MLVTETENFKVFRFRRYIWYYPRRCFHTVIGDLLLISDPGEQPHDEIDTNGPLQQRSFPSSSDDLYDRCDRYIHHAKSGKLMHRFPNTTADLTDEDFIINSPDGLVRLHYPPPNYDFAIGL